MSELAEYTYPINSVDAQQILSSAISTNSQLHVRPQAGVHYIRLSNADSNQANAVISHFKNLGTPNSVLIAANAIVEELAFRPDSFRRFERNLNDAAFMLGFTSQMPERDYGKGSDVLWAIGNMKYLVIECKNEATTETISKSYCNQLAGSMNWFREQYDQTCQATPIIVHPSRAIEYAATLPPGSRIITEVELAAFRSSFVSFCRAVTKLPGYGSTVEVSRLLSSHNLSPENLISRFTTLQS